MKEFSKKAMTLVMVVVISLSFFTGTALAEEWKMTLEQAVERAVVENRNVEIAKQRLVELHGIKAEALSTGLPQIVGTSTYQRTWQRPTVFINSTAVKFGSTNSYSAGAQLNQLLWDGGRVIKAYRAAKAEEARGLETIRDAEEQVRLQVKETFHEALYTDKVIGVLEKQLKQLNGHLRSIKTRFGQGIDSDYTLMRQEVEVSNVEPQLIDAKRNKELLINGMKVLLAIPQEDAFIPAGEFDYRPTAMSTDIIELTEKAKLARPDLTAEKLRVKSLEQNVGIEKSGYWPNFSFNTSYQWQAQTEDFGVSSREHASSFNSGLALTWNLFDGLKTAARVKQARAKLAQQRFSTSQFEDNVVKEVRDIYEILMRARSSLMSQQRSLALARRATAIAGERFEAGLMSQLELNDTITSQSKAEQLYLRAAFDCMNAEAALEKAVGGKL